MYTLYVIDRIIGHFQVTYCTTNSILSPTCRTANSGCMLTGHFSLIMNRFIRVRRKCTKGGTQPLQAVGSPDDRSDGTAIQSFGQRVPGHVRLHKQTPFNMIPLRPIGGVTAQIARNELTVPYLRRRPISPAGHGHCASSK